MSRAHHRIPAVLLLGFLLTLASCGSDDDGTTPAVPSGLALATGDTTLWVGEQTTIEANLLYKRAAGPTCAWYVNDLLGGGTDVGTITQDNPATYTAPQQEPLSGQVQIRAVWADDEAMEATQTVQIGTPVVQLQLPASQIQVAETLSFNAALTKAAPGAAEFEWYVDNVLGGNATVGTITQETPATYTAPADPPAGGAVAIKARWTVNPELYHATANLAVRFTIKHVNADTGVDDPAGGRITAPFKTITYALQRMSDTSTHGDTILVAPGVYHPTLGEQFPKTIKWETTLRGADRDGCIIDADPAVSNMFYISTSSTIENFTIRNLEFGTSGTSRAIVAQGPATIRNIKVNEPFNGVPIRAMNPGVVARIENCELNNTHTPGERIGIELVQPAQGLIYNCRLIGWELGLKITGPAAHLVEGCEIRNNYFGIQIYSDDSNPDLGGGAAGSLGGNVIQNNHMGIFSQSIHDVSALYNTWSEIPPVECEFESDAPCDIYNNNGGAVIWE